jgi:hypothetical protein
MERLRCLARHTSVCCKGADPNIVHLLAARTVYPQPQSGEALGSWTGRRRHMFLACRCEIEDNFLYSDRDG